MQQHISDLSRSNEDGGSSLDRLRTELASVKSMVAVKDAEIQNMTNALRENHAETRELRREMEANAASLASLRAAHGEQQSATETIKFAADRAKTEAQEAAMVAGQTKRAIEAERQARERAERELDELKGKERVATRRCKNLEDRLDESQQRLDTREREVVALKERLAGLEELDPEGVVRETSNLRKQLQNAAARMESTEEELDGVKRERARVTMQLRRGERSVERRGKRILEMFRFSR
jgi:chromosome segregation ATPase